jgi:UDP-GlcNAc:undecaprenyl-phosphate GlcNAc-1-phosphate transferase
LGGTDVNSFSSFMAAFLVTVIGILVLRPVAFAVDLLDRPGGRKTHQGAIPLVGGLAMFLGLAVSIGLLTPISPSAGPLLAVCGLMVIVGLLDDRFEVSHRMRLVTHVVAGAVLIGTTHVVVRTLGDPFGLGTVGLPTWVAVAFTMAMITAAVNSFNMLDGMDGLAGVNALASLAGLAWMAGRAGQAGLEARSLCLLLGACVLGFMVFNAPIMANRRIRCFMGDAGSTFIGVAIAWLCAAISQMPLDDGRAHPSYVLWMVALPLFELWWTFIRRTSRGHSPFHADAGHFHHLIIQAGLNVRTAFGAFLLLDALLVGSGMWLAAHHAPDWLAFLGLFVAAVLVVRSMYQMHHVARRWPLLRRQLPTKTA